jgi:hypothetical protein
MTRRDDRFRVVHFPAVVVCRVPRPRGGAHRRVSSYKMSDAPPTSHLPLPPGHPILSQSSGNSAPVHPVHRPVLPRPRTRRRPDSAPMQRGQCQCIVSRARAKCAQGLYGLSGFIFRPRPRILPSTYAPFISPRSPYPPPSTARLEHFIRRLSLFHLSAAFLLSLSSLTRARFPGCWETRIADEPRFYAFSLSVATSLPSLANASV